MTAPLPPAPLAARRRRAALALAGALALLAGACSGGDGTTAADRGTSEPKAATTAAPAAAEVGAVAEPGTYAVGSLTETVVDASRITQASNGEPELPECTLPTLVLYPAEGDPGTGAVTPDADPAPGPWPVIVFSHGLGGEGPSYVTTLRVWASAGYVVVAPTYPLSNTDSPGGATASDVPAQTADVAFLVDWTLDRAAATDGPLAGLVAPDRIGLGGHSLGAFTSLGVGYNPCCRDERVRAVAEWAGGYVPRLGEGGGNPVDDGPPLLIVHGDADGTVSHDQGVALDEAIDAPTTFVTLVGGEHTPPYVQGLDGDATSTVATSATLDFFDRYLKDDAEGLDRLQAVVDEAGPAVATVTVDAG